MAPCAAANDHWLKTGGVDEFLPARARVVISVDANLGEPLDEAGTTGIHESIGRRDATRSEPGDDVLFGIVAANGAQGPGGRGCAAIPRVILLVGRQEPVPIGEGHKLTSQMAEITEHPCAQLATAARRVLAAEDDKEMGEALLDLAIALEQLTRPQHPPPTAPDDDPPRSTASPPASAWGA